MQTKSPHVERTATGWIAYGQGLAARGQSREDALSRYLSLVKLVRDLAANWRPTQADRSAISVE